MYYGLAGIASLTLSLFFLWGHSGPYRLVADLQQSLWGVNILQLSLLVCWIVLYAPMHFGVHQIEKRSGVKQDPQLWKRAVATFNFLSDERPGQVVTFGIVAFAMGGWLLMSALTSGPLTTLSVAAVEAGEKPASRYVRLTGGKILPDAKMTFTRNSSVEFYFPVIGTADPDPDQITVFVRLDGRDALSPPDEIVGELEYDGLPGALRAGLADKHLIAPNYFVVRHGRNPGEQTSFLSGLCVVGATAIVAGLLWAKSRKTARS